MNFSKYPHKNNSYHTGIIFKNAFGGIIKAPLNKIKFVPLKIQSNG